MTVIRCTGDSVDFAHFYRNNAWREGGREHIQEIEKSMRFSIVMASLEIILPPRDYFNADDNVRKLPDVIE